MALRVEFGITCPHCNEWASGGYTLLMDFDEKNPRIDIEMAASQESFYCEYCECTFYTSDLDYIAEPEECTGGLDDDEDEEGDDA